MSGQFKSMLAIPFKVLMAVAVFLLLISCQSAGYLLSGSSSEYGESLSKQQKAADMNVQLGIAYLQQGYTVRAKSKLLLALRQAPHWPPALDAMAYYLEMTGDNALAQQYYKKALYFAPQEGRSQNNYGAYLCRTGQYSRAIDHFIKAVQDPNYIETAEAYENAGLCALKIPNNALAEQYFLKAIRLDPHRETSMLELAHLKSPSAKALKK